MTSRSVRAACLLALFALPGAAVLHTVPNAIAQTFTLRTDLLQADPSAAFLNPLGAASVDFDGDGRIDIYQMRRLYRNIGAEGFVDVFEQSDLDEGDIPFGAIFGDYDNDGLPDVFFMDLEPPSHLFRNDGDGTFTRTDRTAVLETDDTHIQGSVWLDFDLDGDLDLFVGGDGDPDELFVNHDGVRFSNAGQFEFLDVERGVYGAAAADYDRDGDIDIYVTACRHSEVEASTNMMWINENGSFHTTAIGVEDDGLGWGTVWFDYDNDGWLDLFVANDRVGVSGRSDRNVLYRNTRDGRFENVTASAGVGGGFNERGFSAAAADFDNDGWTDLYVLNYFDGTDKLYRNNGDGTFTDVYESAGLESTDNGALTIADYDSDGYVDIFLGSNDGGVLYMNDGGQNHWLEVNLRGTTVNRFGVGARVEIFRYDELWQVREISAGDGMTSQNNALMAHFGLGTEAVIDSLHVVWPGGHIDRHYDIAADRRVTIVQGAVSIDTKHAEVPDEIPLDAWPNPFDRRIELSVDTGPTGRAEIHVIDVLGREVRRLEAVGSPGTAVWDGRDASGVDVPPGVYVIRARSGPTAQIRTVTRIR